MWLLNVPQILYANLKILVLRSITDHNDVNSHHQLNASSIEQWFYYY